MRNATTTGDSKMKQSERIEQMFGEGVRLEDLSPREVAQLNADILGQLPDRDATAWGP